MLLTQIGDKSPSGKDESQERAMGFEAIANTGDSAGNQQDSQAGAAKASAGRSRPVPAEAELAEIVDAWPALPEALRAGILAMVRGVRK